MPSGKRISLEFLNPPTMKKLILTISIFITIFNSFSQEKINSTEQLPLLAWWGIPASETSVARYQELKDAGITYQFSPFPNADEMQKALDAALKAGIKMVVSCPELKTETEKTVRRFMNHPAVVGYHLMDEPGIKGYVELGNWARKIKAIDSKHFCYVNLFPNIADSNQLGTTSYRDYVRECAKQIPVDFLSFDFYPVYKDHLAPSWYENLEMISDEARKANKPFWAFTASTNFDNKHLTPQTLASMRLQVYSDLAYGAQGIQYFTYWSATSLNAPSSEDQRGAPISASGKRSVVYDRVKQLNEELKNLSGVFMGSKVVWVRHTGKDMIPSGTVRLTKLPEPIKVLDTNGDNALVSLLENGDNYFLIIVNKDFLNSITLNFYGDASVKRILKDGSIVAANAYESSMEVEAGDAVIYMFKK